MPSAALIPIRLTPEDALRYAELRKEMLRESPWAFGSAPGDDVGSNPTLMAERLAGPENAILAIEETDRLLAVAGVARSPRIKMRHRASIWGVYTRPECRGRGCGRAVTLAAVETARAWPGVAAIGLSVTSNAAAALALYESLGFIKWGVEPDSMRVDGQSFDEVHMLLPL